MPQTSRVKRLRLMIGILIVLARWFPAYPIEQARAITITMSYSDEGSPLPHPENPAWDPAGTVLKAHFERAKQIWEQLLPGPGDFEFDFQWDDDIDGLGLTTKVGVFDTFIEINPNYNWYADPFPATDDEFSAVGVQTLYSDLSPANQATYFVGNPPPGALETGFFRSGMTGAVGAGGYDAHDGFDLLSTVVHEIGHVLGIDHNDLGDVYFEISPEHIGGTAGVFLPEGEGGHLSGGVFPGPTPGTVVTIPGYLMCNGCAVVGQRRYPTATDVLVVANEAGISDVQLQRVGRIFSGLWNEPNAWIGGDVPGFPQDVYITHGGLVTLSTNASARDLLVDSGSSLVVQDHTLSSTGILEFAGATTVSVGAGGSIFANQVVRGATDIGATAGSLVQFNSYEGGAGNSAHFNGNVGIGSGSSSDPEVTFDPTAIKTWTIGQQLSIGDFRSAHLVIDNMMSVTSASGRIGSGILTGSAGRVTISGASTSWTISDALDVRSGSIDLSNSARLYSGSGAVGGNLGLSSVNISSSALWSVYGDLNVGPQAGVGEAQGLISIHNSGDLSVDGNASIRGTATRTGEVSVASDGAFRVDGSVSVGPFGVLTYRDQTYAHSGVLGSDTLENLGGSSDSSAGGITRFWDTSRAGNVHIANHPGSTLFAYGGETQFRNFSTAESARIDNLRSTVSFQAGTTRFFDFATAGEAEFYNQPGFVSIYATVEFNDDSSGGDGTFVNLPGVLSQSSGGAIVFNDRSKAGFGTYASQGEGGIVDFNDSSDAEHGTFSTADNIGGNSYVQFNDSSTAGNATFTIRTNTSLKFNQNATAGSATIHLLRPNPLFGSSGGLLSVSGGSLANATIDVEGGGTIGYYGGSVALQNLGSTAGNANISLLGGTAQFTGGANLRFDYSSSAGTAVIIAHSGTNGGSGGVVEFARGATGENSRINIEAGAVLDVGGNRIYGGTSIGKLEGGGTFALGGSLLAVGGLGLDSTISGVVTDGNNPDGRLNKIGAGTLALDGVNTYTGLTTVAAGRMLVNGSIVGDVLVDAGATLGGTGTIGGNVAVANGGIISPGASPGTIRVGSLSLNAASILNFEFGVVSDLLIVQGDLTLDGILNITPGLGFNAFGKEILSYTGTLTDNGLTIGSVPAGFTPTDFTLDFSVPGEIRFLGPTETVPGDYNFNGIVDAADYTVWRNNLGSGTALPNDDSPGVGPDDYDRWKAHFGMTASSGAGAGSSAAAPEPGSFGLLVVALISFAMRRRITS
jgi:autotransporter-associated beta strand protein